jgi:transposase-like protein
VAKGYRYFTQEFKDSAAREVVEKSRSITEVANQLGVYDGTLRRWVRAYRERRPELLRERGVDPAGDEELRARVRELEKENRLLREREVILKKAAAFFAQDHL